MPRFCRRYVAHLAVVLILVLFPITSRGQELEDRFIHLASAKTRGVLPIIEMSNGSTWGLGRVVGTGFLLNRQGYFLTAAHVVSKLTKENKDEDPATHRVIYNVNLTGFPLSSFTAGSSIVLIDKDEVRDIALCQIPTFEQIEKQAQMPFPTFRIVTEVPAIGSFTDRHCTRF